MIEKFIYTVKMQVRITGENNKMFFFKRKSINEAVKECRQTPGAILVDVRETNEFHSGHISGAVNVPLSRIGTIEASKDRPLYLYCLRGNRSRQAVRVLKQMGYADLRSIGGINGYKGQLER